MLLQSGSSVVFTKSHPEQGKVGTVVNVAWCDISRDAMFRIRIFDDKLSEFVEVYAFSPDIRGFHKPSEKVMRRHAEHRQALRERAMV